MTDNPTLFLEAGNVVCPKCYAPVVSTDSKHLLCKVCETQFPLLKDVYVLVENTDAYLSSWAQQFRNFILNQQSMIQHEQRLMSDPNLYPPFGQRLKNSVQARTANLQAIAELMSPLREMAITQPQKSDIKSAGQFASPVYLLRDWGWNTNEPDLMCDKVKQILPQDLRPESMLVLGAGGCGESYILHEFYQCPLTVSVEIDPFKLLGASHLLSGGKLSLYQIMQTNIRNAQNHVSQWNLRAPESPSNEFKFVLADVRKRLPFSDSAFHVLFTPFIIDAIGIDLRNLVPHIHRVIRPGGIWVNFGVLSFQPEFSYTGEEVLSIVESSGFKVLNHGYMKKPHVAPRESCLEQIFDCLYFTAEKI